MHSNNIFLIEKTQSIGITYKLRDSKTDKIVYQIKERKKGITKSKTQFFISGPKHTQYISSIYPINKDTTFSGYFDIDPNSKYTIEYKALSYTLNFDTDTCTIVGGIKEW